MGRIVLADSFRKNAAGVPVIKLSSVGEAILGDPSVWSYIGFTADQISGIYQLTYDNSAWKEEAYTPTNPRVVLSYIKLPDEESEFKVSTLLPLLDTSSDKYPSNPTGPSQLAVSWAESWRRRLSYLHNTEAHIALYLPPNEGLLYGTSADWKSKDGSLGTYAEIIQKCPRFTAGAGTLLAVQSGTNIYLYLLLSHFLPAPFSDTSEGESLNEFISPLLPNFDVSFPGGPVVGMWTALWWTVPDCLKDFGGGAVPKLTSSYLSGPKYAQYVPSESGKGVRWALFADSWSLAPIMARRVDGDVLLSQTQKTSTEALWISGQMSHRFGVLRNGDVETSVFEVLV